MLIKIDKTVTLEELDNCYKKLYRFAEIDAPVNFLLPKSLENNFIGLVPSII